MFTNTRTPSVTVQGVLRRSFPVDSDLAQMFDRSLGGKAIMPLATTDGMETAGDVGLTTWLYRLIGDEQTLKQRLGSEVLFDGW
jgi:hypothetical protein